MNYIRHLNAFFFRHVKRDRRFNANHISLYMALFQCWNANRFQNPFSITRENVMGICGIGSKNTYHKCLKELHQFGYIFYKPSINKFHKSTVHIVKLDAGDSSDDLKQLELFSPTSGPGNTAENLPITVPNPVQVKDFTGIKIETVSVPILTAASPKYATVPVPYLGLLIKHKHINSKQERAENSLTQKIFSKNKKLQECINAFSAAPKNEKPIHPSSFPSPDREGFGVMFQKPTLDQVRSFFQEHSYPITEAQKFYNHYQSNGWMVAGKTPMHDWQSSAHKWMLNTANFINIQNPKNVKQHPDFDTTPGKDYSQPL